MLAGLRPYTLQTRVGKTRLAGVPERQVVHTRSAQCPLLSDECSDASLQLEQGIFDTGQACQVDAIGTMKLNGGVFPPDDGGGSLWLGWQGHVMAVHGSFFWRPQRSGKHSHGMEGDMLSALPFLRREAILLTFDTEAIVATSSGC